MSATGTDLSVGARRLTPDTEYTFIVTALTNEGKFESKATKKRTSKDECELKILKHLNHNSTSLISGHCFSKSIDNYIYTRSRLYIYIYIYICIACSVHYNCIFVLDH